MATFCLYWRGGGDGLGVVVETVGGGRSNGRWWSSRDNGEEAESSNERGEKEHNIVHKDD